MAWKVEFDGAAEHDLDLRVLPLEAGWALEGQVLGPDVPTAVLSGPTFAKEVGAGLPSAMASKRSSPTGSGTTQPAGTRAYSA